MAYLEIESLWQSITKKAGYMLLGAFLGSLYGCSREKAYQEQHFQEKIQSNYDQIRQLVPAKKHSTLEKIIWGNKNDK